MWLLLANLHATVLLSPGKGECKLIVFCSLGGSNTFIGDLPVTVVPCNQTALAVSTRDNIVLCPTMLLQNAVFLYVIMIYQRKNIMYFI